ncbi:unnamed protein product, partial [Mesorhabditis spiculigera]
MKRLAEEAVENSKLISAQNIYADGLSISDTLREKADAFERHFEEYLPLARIYNEKLTDLADQNQALIRQFKKGLAIAESPEKSEEAEVSTRSATTITAGQYPMVLTALRRCSALIVAMSTCTMRPPKMSRRA